MMNKYLGLLIVICIVLVGLVGASQMDLFSQDTAEVQLDNQTDNLNDTELLTSIIINKTNANSKNIDKSVEVLTADLTKDEIKEAYTRILGKYTNESVNVEVSDLKTLENGTKYYRVTTNVRYKGVYDDESFMDTPQYNQKYDFTQLYIFDAVSNVKPKDVSGQDIEITGVMTYIQPDPDSNVKISVDEIINKSRELYSQKNVENNALRISQDDKYYWVDESTYIFDANSGELIFDNSKGDTYYDKLCQQAVMEKIDQENIEHPENISLSSPKIDVGRLDYTFTYDIIYNVNGEKHKIGNAKVDAYTRSVLSFNITLPADNQVSDGDETVNDTVSDDVVDEDLSEEDIEEIEK